MLTQRLMKLRKEKKKTQDDVATFLGISRPAYGNYENGKREPDLETLTKLADYFDVSMDYLIGRSIARTPEQGMAFSGGGKDWTEEEIRMAEAIAAAAIENMRKQQGK